MSTVMYARKPAGVTKRYRAKRRRAEKPVADKVRAACVERDGHCRICDWENNPHDTHPDEGPVEEGALPYPTDFADSTPEWAHLRGKTRAETRGMKPEQRHTTEKSLMLCRFHHACYDGRRKPRVFIRELTQSGADGPLQFTAGPF